MAGGGGSVVDLFALRDETLAFQIAIEPGGERLEGIRVSLGPFLTAEGDPREELDGFVETFAEQFIAIARPTGNDRDGSSLAFEAKAAPPAGAYVGAFADALVPGAPASAGPEARGAIWVDVHVGREARAGTYRAEAIVTADAGGADGGARTLATRAVRLRVGAAALPYPGAAITTFYDGDTLERRMGDREAERSLRQTLHAHRVSAIRPVVREEDVDEERAALTGALYTAAAGYVGPGAGIGEGILAVGAYGALGDPDADKAARVGRIAERLGALGVRDRTVAFVYAIDEVCASPRAGRWREALAHVPGARDVRVGVTCGDDPRDQAADLVMMTSDRYAPAKVERARERGKRVWVYNGQRPYAGPMMLDVPAVDLRANGWIAARFGVERWFYWESTFWLDGNRGGRGGEHGFDPFTVAETFHNAHGDRANGDGILLYPGTQRVAGMRDDGVRAVYPSIRLKNLRRGAQDAGYIALARAVDPGATRGIEEGMVPRALAEARGAASWPAEGKAWLDARRALLRVIEGDAPPQPANVGRVASRSALVVVAVCAIAAVSSLAIAFVARRLNRRRK